MTTNFVYKTIDFTLNFDVDDFFSSESADKNFWDDFTGGLSQFTHAIAPVFPLATSDGIKNVLPLLPEVLPLLALRTDFVHDSDIVVDKLEALGEDLDSGFRAVVHVGRSYN